MKIGVYHKEKYFEFLETVKQRVEVKGKDFTQKQFSEMFKVSRKTFESFYNGKIIRFDLLFELALMYEFEIIIN